MLLKKGFCSNANGALSWLLLLLTSLVAPNANGNAASSVRQYSNERKLELREAVRAMFQHAYDGYLTHAAGYDELRPLTCDGVDTWGSYSLTLIDALDTLATMGNFSEFRRVALHLQANMDFNKDINVSVFETNIRIVGGLLSAHLLANRAGLPLERGWPCQGPLLRLAEDVAQRLLPAFNTATGMPYGTVNLRHGVPKGETPVTCTAGISTFLVEFGTLSRLTGKTIYEEVALNAVYGLWERRSPIGLFGNHIDVQTGRWTALDSGIGAGVDSLFEYLVKGAILLNRPDLLEMFHEARSAIDRYLKRDHWYVWASMNKGQMTLPVFQSLEAFWPGVLSIIGDNGPAIRTLTRYSSVWRKYGFLPEFFNIPAREASPNRESYPLRPELIESAMYLYRATKNQFLLELGENILETIEFSAKTRCGYATIRNVVTHEKENRMESFFLAETTKYLYLLFDEDNFLHNDAATGEYLETSNGGECVVNAGPHIFNTEAHPVDMSALYCCYDLQEDIYDELNIKAFSDSELLKVEREKSLFRIFDHKYQCGAMDSVEQQYEAASTQSAHSHTNISVDIEVYDDYNNPAAEVLIENFEMIRQEQQHGHKIERLELPRSQLTATDLEDFFNVKRTHFPDATQTLNYVTGFMRNYTLDAAFISGLHLFDKNISAVLGASVQKEYEGRTRSIWELYELQQQYAVNVQLITRLGLLAFEDQDLTMLDNVLRALNQSKPMKDPDTDASFARILKKINLTRELYENALVNTTAMQEFLMKIFSKGTTAKNHNFNPLLDDTEISSLNADNNPELDETAAHKLFANVRRVLEFKKHMIETFEQLQALMQENNKQSQASMTEDITTTTARSTSAHAYTSKSVSSEQDQDGGDGSEATVAETSKFVSSSSKPTEDGAFNNHGYTVSNESKPEEESGGMGSVWSQLVQTILRKTTTQRTKFDEQMLLQKTRNSLKRHMRHRRRMQHELFTCKRPTFLEKFAYREFYP